MKRKKLLILAIYVILWALFGGAVYANTQNFYFESAEFDYYLSRAEDGGSVMKVRETLTAIFPDYDQNHGIERCLPINYNGLQTLDVDSFAATRNGSPENVSYYSKGEQVCFQMGDVDKFVHGEQTYILQYSESNVISEPESAMHQMLYWDINGTDWDQTFNQVTARVHLEGESSVLFDGGVECYVGPYGAGSKDATSRCVVSEMVDNVITFESNNVITNETMTILMNFLPGSFEMAEPELGGQETIEAMDSAQESVASEDSIQEPANGSGAVDSVVIINSIIYICIVAGVSIMLLVFIAVYLYFLVKFRKCLPRIVERTSPMEYTPPNNLSVAEANLIYNYLGSPSNAAVILELALKNRIALEATKKVRKKLFTKHEDKTIKWNLYVKNANRLKPYQYAVLMALNKNKIPETGDKLKIDLQTKDASDRVALLKSAGEETVDILIEKGLLKKGAKQNDPYPMWIIACQVSSGVGLLFTLIPIARQSFANTTHMSAATALAAWFFGAVGFGTILLLGFMLPYIYNKITEKRTLVRFYTEEGIKTKLYLDGLCKYMKLTEAERIKFLQSVPGVDISDKGIVKLYEKLLPYALIFGLESMWIMELEQYYRSADIDGPSWAADGETIDCADLDNLCLALGMYVGNSQGSGDIYTGGDFDGGGGGGGGGDGGGFSGGGGGGGGGGGW